MFTSDLSRFNLDGIIVVDLLLLRDLDLLNVPDNSASCNLQQYPFYFHVLEEETKVTLFNHQFVVWIVPQHREKETVTYVMIGLLQEETTTLEVIFSVEGIYNTPKYILRVLRHYLQEVIAVEEGMNSLFFEEK